MLGRNLRSELTRSCGLLILKSKAISEVEEEKPKLILFPVKFLGFFCCVSVFVAVCFGFLIREVPALFPEEKPEKKMGEPNFKSLRDYALPTTSGIQSAIVMPTIGANNFEIKPAMIQMMHNSYAFRGMPDDDPNLHLASFLEVCETFKLNGVSADAIRMRLFPFSLKDRAKEWLQSMPHESITTWEDLATKFLARFFPPARTAKLR